MDFSIIIINYKTINLTLDCVESIFAHCPGGNFEIIVLDNNSQDGSVAKLQNTFGNTIKVVANESNLGFAGANNIGANLARGKYLFFLNSDTKFTDNILPIIKTTFENHPDFSILGPQVLLADTKAQAGAYGHFPTLLTLLSRQTKKNWKKNIQPDLWQSDWLSGAALVIQKEKFQEIGGWDENFFLYFEDVDLCLRTQKTGGKIGICPGINIIHYGGSSLEANQQRKAYYYQSQNYFFRQHYGLISATLMRLIRWPYKIYSYYRK